MKTKLSTANAFNFLAEIIAENPLSTGNYSEPYYPTFKNSAEIRPSGKRKYSVGNCNAANRSNVREK